MTTTSVSATRLCAHCGGTFTPKSRVHKYCLRLACIKGRSYRTKRGAAEDVATTACIHCGASFAPRKPTDKFCRQLDCMRTRGARDQDAFKCLHLSISGTGKCLGCGEALGQGIQMQEPN